MVVDTLENLEKYTSLNPLFVQAIDFIRSHDQHTMEMGKTELQGKNLVVNIALTTPKTKEQAKLAKYCSPADVPYNEDDDITFFEGAAEAYIPVKPGMFTIFFPEDGHAPGISSEGVKKVIIKVKA